MPGFGLGLVCVWSLFYLCLNKIRYNQVLIHYEASVHHHAIIFNGLISYIFKFPPKLQPDLSFNQIL